MSLRPVALAWHIVFDPHAFLQSGQVDNVLQSSLVANIYRRTPGNNAQLWDIEPASHYQPGLSAQVETHLVRNAQRFGVLWVQPECAYDPHASSCVAGRIDYTSSNRPEQVSLGTDYPSVLGASAVRIDTAQFGFHDAPLGRPRRIIKVPGTALNQFGGSDTYLVAWQQAPGVILYSPVQVPNYSGCAGFANELARSNNGAPDSLDCFLDGAVLNDGVGKFWQCPQSTLVNGCQAGATFDIEIGFVAPGRAA